MSCPGTQARQSPFCSLFSPHCHFVTTPRFTPNSHPGFSPLPLSEQDLLSPLSISSFLLRMSCLLYLSPPGLLLSFQFRKSNWILRLFLFHGPSLWAGAWTSVARPGTWVLIRQLLDPSQGRLLLCGAVTVPASQSLCRGQGRWYVANAWHTGSPPLGPAATPSQRCHGPAPLKILQAVCPQPPHKPRETFISI